MAIGRNPPAENIHPNIHFTGSVDEVGPWLRACDLAVIPLREGGGTRMKIIDCFAASRSQYPELNQEEVTVTIEQMKMDAWLELTESKALREQLSAAGLKFTSEMDWKSICKRYLDIYSAVRRIPK